MLTEFWLGIGIAFGVGLFIGAGTMSAKNPDDMPMTGVLTGLAGFFLALLCGGILFAIHFASHLAWVP